MVTFHIDRGGAVIVAAVLLIGVGRMAGDPVAGLLLGALTVASLLLHECGHLLAARILRVKVREIGVCLRGPYIRRESARTPLDEATIAMSGPMMNAMTAAALWAMPGVGHWLAIYNLILFISNMAPIPGSDGKRILTAWRQATDLRPAIAPEKQNSPGK